jgi:transcriptional regulator with XRE-family HTH domain
MGNTKETIGARVRRLRRMSTDLNQAELARAIEVDPATMNQIERDKRKPSRETIERLARRLNTTTDYLMNGTEIDGQAHARQETRAPEPATNRQDFGFSAAIQAKVYTTLSAIFADFSAELAARAEADSRRETTHARIGTPARAASR